MALKHMPRVALPVRPERARERYGNYFAAMERAGATAEPVWAEVDAAAFDALLLPGGGDIHPMRYGEAIDGSRGIDPELDGAQLAALDAFVRAGRPVLGVCRGHQLVNVYFGGSLFQDIETGETHAQRDGIDRDHDTAVLPGSFLHGLYGDRVFVNSAHHQAVKELAGGLEAVQWAEDGIVEAMRHRALPVFAVQWHPERMRPGPAGDGRRRPEDGMALLEWFVQTL